MYVAIHATLFEKRGDEANVGVIPLLLKGVDDTTFSRISQLIQMVSLVC